ncbi:hypothetical protein BU24DRAFT_467801 [Aaosphaeria arxii CBS 175.79]|uniref:3-hydroxyisobutyrate dehydrogenase n=1 Tax=Aaosphaeria arxii CBS 175.79 TaxID=1450172 RepID=A0A6A5X930_9PLEO|nr:uncharacterized protein BU24DRAFT_467801 [Aaosphaeria arxii CBS 175.79]KAF2009420.1 hypothetical protein BU24DRAFT_467801 [Aaosphaeria arxii CBS 175.79]
MGLLEARTIGFIGLGAMGSPMARRIAEKLPPGSQMYVYDVVQPPMDAISEAFPGKIVKAVSPKHVAEHANLIISMVPEGRHVRSVYLDNETGITAANISDHIILECSTIDRSTSLAVKKHINTNFPKAEFYDAPVTGGVLGAEKGTLAFFLGCNENDPNFKSLVKLLQHVGRQVISCGGPSFGIATKLTNNYLSGLIAIASSEAMNMGMRAGIDPRVLSQALAAGTAQNAILDRFNPVPGVVPDAPSSNGYQGGFKVQLMRKDFALAVDMAKETNAKTILGPLGLKTYEDATNDPRCWDLDSRVVFRHIGGNENWKKNADI